MENNNRQGCREEAIGFGLFILAGRYERFTDGIFGAWQGKEDRKLYSNDELYTLYKQQSIEPCATSSRIEELEKGLSDLIFTASKLWDDAKPIKDTDIIKVTHPTIEEAKQILNK